MLYIGSSISSQFLFGGWFGYPRVEAGKPGVPQSMGSHRVGHDGTTEKQEFKANLLQEQQYGMHLSLWKKDCFLFALVLRG